MSETLDAAVIGAGAVGLAVAARLARPGRQVAVFERRERHGLETSSRSSEVIHAGLYYPEGSLKARLCVAGRLALYGWAAEGALPARKTGKLVVARDRSELGRLEALLARGRANGAEGLALVDGGDIARFAPGVRGAAALWSPESGVMDTEALMALYRRRAEDAGAMIVCGRELYGVERSGDEYLLRLTGEPGLVRTRAVVNAGGLGADWVAALAGFDVDALGWRLSWFKGEYFSLKSVLPPRCLVYPLPETHGLGVHLTVDLRGRQRLGPNAFRVADLDYEVDPAHGDAFFEAAAPFFPALKRSHLQPGTSGIRAKLSGDGSFRDFVIEEGSSRGFPGWVNLLGIDSPGLTASPAIAALVGDVLEWPA